MSAPRAIALCYCFQGALEFQAGRWSEAEAALRESIRLYREIGAASGEALACQRLGVLLTARGELDEALQVMQEGSAAAERALMRAHCLTRLYAAMTRNRLVAGDLPAADQYLTLGLEMSQRHGNCATCDALLLPAAITLRLAQGALRAAEQFCRQLEQAANQYASSIWVAMARQARGELAAAGGDLETALACYADAYGHFRAANYEYEAARCQAAVAELHHRAQNEAQARTARLAADQTFARLGAASLHWRTGQGG
jgi:predicted negative regulator of RcsB-dependent stress response